MHETRVMEISRVSFFNGSGFPSVFSRVSICDSNFPREYFSRVRFFNGGNFKGFIFEWFRFFKFIFKSFDFWFGFPNRIFSRVWFFNGGDFKGFIFSTIQICSRVFTRVCIYILKSFRGLENFRCWDIFKCFPVGKSRLSCFHSIKK